MKNLKRVRPKKSDRIPVTKVMLTRARYELKHEVTEVRLEMRAGFKRVDSQFKEVDARFKEVDSRFDRVDARFKEVDARFDRVDARLDKMDASFLDLKADIQKVLAGIQRVELKVDAQDAKNNYVLDGYTNLYDRVAKLEAKKIDS